MALQVSQVLPGQVDAVWLQVDRLVARGLRQTGDDSTTSALIREDVRYGRLAMWVVHDDQEIVAVVVLNIVKRLTGPVLIVVLIAGRDFQSWAPQVQTLLQDYKDLIGARKIESVSRVGMEGWMKKLGWRKKAVMMEWTDG